MWELRRLRLLHELAARGTIAEVATSLHLSPSAVSQQLTQLEREAGVSLLRRTGRTLTLTPEGEILVRHTRTVLGQLELAQAEIAAAHETATGTVRLAVFQSAALALIPHALTLLATEHPQLRVTVTQREPETALRETWARDFDLVVAEEYPDHGAPWAEGLDRQPLTRDSLHLTTPSASAGSPLDNSLDDSLGPSEGTRWADVRGIEQTAGLPWVLEPVGAASRHWTEQLCRRAGFEPDVRYETADLQAHLALVASGHAVAVMSGLMLRTLMPGRADVQVLDLPESPERTIFTATRSTAAAHPGVRAVREALEAAAALGQPPASHPADSPA